MTHWRTSRQTVGGNQSGGSPYGTDTRAELIPFPSGSPIERRKASEPTPNDRELGSGLFFLAVFVLPPLIVLAVVFGYAAFVPQPVEYQIGVYADR